LKTGWAFSLYLNRHILCADTIEASTYYSYNYNVDNTGGVWRSIDGGANWTRLTSAFWVRSFESASAFATLIAVPGYRGHLLFANGTYSNYVKTLKRSVDGGATWYDVAGVAFSWMAACGKAPTGKTYPTVFMIGTLTGDSKPAVYRADNMTTDPTAKVTWTRLTYAPANSLDTPHTLCGDLDEYGAIYIGQGASGYVYGRLAK
jgi:hypothetical protein